MDADFDIGARLRAVRTANRLSQRQLARQVDVSHATISLIELNRTNPSVGLLKKILDGVPMALADFFAMEAAEPRQVFFAAGDLVEIAGGAISYRQVGRDMTGRKLQMLHEVYKPGADTGRSMISHEAEEGGIVLGGRLEVTVGDQKRVLGPGDSYYFDSRTPHRFRNVGKEECELVTACTPPSV